MAASIVASVPPLPPLPPSPKHDSSTPLASGDNDRKQSDSGMESPTRSPYTSASFGTGTNTSINSKLSVKPGVQPQNEVDNQPDGISTPFYTKDQLSYPKNGRTQPRLARLDDYELIRVLGKGCAGRVLLVRETQTARVLAMKAISKRSVLTHDELHHTLTESRILRQFAIREPQNQFISKLHHSFTDKENFYFVMDFYPGGDLATQMEIHGILGVHRTRFYAADLVQGLEDLHRNGIIMRDLKPGNILLNARGHAVLADFGLSKDFGYRGEPRPLHVVTYAGHPVLPHWAGKGAASLRQTDDGTRKLVVDRAYSFVGTAEYLAPEVVKRGEYSYAVDWWALGCIILEGIIGKSPFRKDEHEPLLVLWNSILHNDWDAIFLEPCMRGRRPSDYNLDHVTWDFIDALLMKDPMWRMTEPCIKSHPYFQYIDWETVRRGEYEDPHDLKLHDVSEYNTHYFPKLCLDEEPSVDMTTHDVEYREHSPEAQTPMTDDALYALEQAKYKAELNDFAWSRELEMAEKTGGIHLVPNGEIDLALRDVNVRADETNLKARGAQHVPVLEDSIGVERHDRYCLVEQERSRSRSPPILETPESSLEQALQIPLPSPSTSGELALLTPPIEDSPLRSPKTEISASSKTPAKPIPLSPKQALIKENGHPNLPTHLPSSGLSVSDLVSVSAADDGSLNRVVRRHKTLHSENSVPASRLSVDLDGKITHLGDDDWEQLDSAEGIESLPNAPHALGGSFFHRVLKRPSSALVGSGLRRQARRSDVSETSSHSPNNVSPVKKNALSTFIRGNGTRKALDMIKTFPNLRKFNNPPHPPLFEDKLGEVRPFTNRRRTESGWSGRVHGPSRATNRSETSLSVPRTGSLGTTGRSFSAKISGNHDHQGKARGFLTMGKSFSGIIRGGRKDLSSVVSGVQEQGEVVPSSAPRVELKKTSPITWELNERS